MVNVHWFRVDLFFFIYHLSWLVFLTRKHIRQVTTKAGHVFEINVQLNLTLNFLLFVFTVDLKLLPIGNISEILHVTTMYSFFFAMTGSQIETILFLKTLNVNTMMTDTAGKVILSFFIFSFGMGVIVTLVQPKEETELKYCEFFTELYFAFAIPSILVLVIVLVVIGYAVFRSHQIRKTSHNEEHLDGVEEAGHEREVGRGHTLNENPYQDRLFTIQELFSELNRELEENRDRETSLGNVEDDLVVEDIELDNIETSVLNSDLDNDRVDEIVASSDENEVTIQETSQIDRNSMIENQQNNNQCLPGIYSMYISLYQVKCSVTET